MVLNFLKSVIPPPLPFLDNATVCAPHEHITDCSMYFSSLIFSQEVSPQKLDSPTQAFDPPSNLSSLPLAPTSVLSPNALEFVPSNPTTAKPTAIKESNISFRGCSMSDTERDNNWSTSKAYDSDFEHLGYGNKQVHLEEESEWETDNGEENEGVEDWHARKSSLNKKNLAKFEHLSKHFQGGTHSKPRRSNRLASLRNQLFEENNLL
ncbi:hypothetical protein DM860_001380 [Cuscuta australis]|uniref:Uncharacterized protein n=1 Tax=Cuscuta australis TaxID=267555 RepID=A0A328E8K2_9ASTE|nr:hypothetical protein DM860_001380 [Cuscuta australis]